VRPGLRLRQDALDAGDDQGDDPAAFGRIDSHDDTVAA